MSENRVLHNLHKIEIDPGEFGSTVRNGTKWADALPGTKLDLCECASPCPAPDHVEERDCIVVGLGEVGQLWTGQFRDIPARLLRNEHEIASRTYDGLLGSMRRAYGDGFLESNQVTVIIYQRMS